MCIREFIPWEELMKIQRTKAIRCDEEETDEKYHVR